MTEFGQSPIERFVPSAHGATAEEPCDLYYVLALFDLTQLIDLNGAVEILHSCYPRELLYEPVSR